MAFDETLAKRLRTLFRRVPRSSERRMFGGLCFLADGRMCCGIVGGDLVVRVGTDGYVDALRRPHARPMDFTGRPMRGFVYVAPPGLRTTKSLSGWVDRALRHAHTVPPRRTKRAQPGQSRAIR